MLLARATMIASRRTGRSRSLLVLLLALLIGVCVSFTAPATSVIAAAGSIYTYDGCIAHSSAVADQAWPKSRAETLGNEHAVLAAGHPICAARAGFAAEGVSVAAGDGAGSSASASLVRTVASHETNPGLFNEMKALTFESGQEHALVRYASGQRAILSGGHTGISGLDHVEELIAHTHPYDIPAQGPSIADYTALNQLGQESSILLEHGLEIPFGVEDPMYLKLFGG